MICCVVDVLPLVYNALLSEHAVVQERALQAIPSLCDTIDYAEVQNSLFPRVAVRFQRHLGSRRQHPLNVCQQLVFTKTHILSVKVATLNCFLSLVKTLDQVSILSIRTPPAPGSNIVASQASLTQKLVPLLSRIKTKGAFSQRADVQPVDNTCS